jgi:starvation-inducible DNA-binding protein
MFMAQYNEIWLAVDLVAERIRALGFPAPGTYKELSRLTTIKDSNGVPNAKEMIRQLVTGQESVVRTARELLPIAEKAGDQPTVDLLSARMMVHEQNAWMLRSLLEE